MDLTQDSPVVTGLMDAQADYADFVVRIELDLDGADVVEVPDDDEVVRQFFELTELGRIQIDILVQNLDRGVKKPRRVYFKLIWSSFNYVL